MAAAKVETLTPELITDRMVDEEKELRMEFLRYGLKSAEKPSDKFFLLQDYISRHLGGTQRQSPARILARPPASAG